MAISNFFTAFYSALSDPAAYYSFQKEMNTKAVEDLYLNTFKGKFSFESVVLAVLPQSVDSTTAQQSIRVRPLELHDLFLPEPCNKFFDSVPGAREAIISMHPVAYSKEAPTRLTVNNGESKILGMSIRPGDIVKCYFVVGPSDQGKLRGLTFEPMTRGSLPRSNMNLRCLTSIATQGAAAMFGGGGYEPVTHVKIPDSAKQGIRTFIKKIKKSPSFSGWSGATIAGVVSNAKSESAFKQLAAGDDVEFYQKAYNNGKVTEGRMNKVRQRNINGKCSWGYWQLNICPDDGSGKALADSKGIDTTTEEGKKRWVELMKSDEEQFAWVSKQIKKILTKGIQGPSPSQAAYDITVEFERPVHKKIKGKERGLLAEEIYKEFKDILG